MISRITTYMLLSAIAVQAVFGGLQNTVSICLGGGHEHEEVAAVVEHCEFECSHHSTFPTPVTEVDIENCECTDLELTLITLLTTPRSSDDDVIVTQQSQPLNFVERATDVQPISVWHGPPQLERDSPAKELQLVVMRVTRLLV